ncbi:hypothetical protein Xcab_04362 [Xenorhabdus cabanillasii JM26]|nr:hypothetical protein Xcab_04362 [Xenorhabdus cabanillasii JM26]
MVLRKVKEAASLALLCLRQDKAKSDRPCFWSKNKKDINAPISFTGTFQHYYLYDRWLEKLRKSTRRETPCGQQALYPTHREA